MAQPTDFIRCSVQHGTRSIKPTCITHDKLLVMCIKDLCKEFQLGPSTNYCLILMNKVSTLITEENRRQLITNNAILRLDLEPTLAAQNILTTLRSDDENALKDVLKDCLTLFTDCTFAQALLKESGHSCIKQLILSRYHSNRELDDEIFKLLLHAFSVLCEMAVNHTNLQFSWGIITQDFINILCHVINNVSCGVWNLKHSLSVINHYLHKNPHQKDVVANKIDPLSIHHQLSRLKDIGGGVLQNIQKHLLSLLNNYLEIRVTQHNRDSLMDAVSSCLSTDKLKVIVKSIPYFREDFNGSLDEGIREQLANIQRFLMYLYLPRVSNPPSVAEQSSLEQLCSLADAPSMNEKLAYKKLGFTNINNPLSEFSECPPGSLAFDCLYYCAMHYPSETEQVMDFQMINSENRFPFVAAGIALTKLLCEVFGIDGAQYSATATAPFCPMLFIVQSGKRIEEAFVPAFLMFHRNWHEMQATKKDLPEVLLILREQIDRALYRQPATVDRFRDYLSEHNATDIKFAFMNQKKRRDDNITSHPTIIDLREKLSPLASKLINQRRLKAMEKGADFKVKEGKRDTLLQSFQLSTNHKAIIHTHTDSKELVKLNTYLLANLTQIQIGGECPHFKSLKSGKTKNPEYYLSLHFLSESEPPESITLNLSTSSEKDYFTWIDALDILRNMQPDSSLYRTELLRLIDLDLKIRMLDLDISRIPTNPPTIPPEPEDYNFGAL